MRARSLAALSFALVVGIAGCGEDDEPAEGPSRDQVQRALDQAVEAGAPGIAVQLNGPHGNEFLTSGFAFLGPDHEITEEDHFRTATVTESLTAAIAMQLVEEDELSLDEAVAPLSSGAPEAGAELIEEVTQNSYEEELETRILAPLDLSETTLVTDNGAPPPGVLITTPDDLATFYEALMAGALIGRDELDVMMDTRPGASDPPGPGRNRVGLGIYGWEVPCGEVWGQSDSYLRFRTLGGARDDGTASIAFMVNATDVSGPTEEAILRAQELAICRALGEDAG